jgi:hypothetical protein
MFIKKITRARLKVLIQPNLVKKSYLYRGIPPLITINNPIKKMNLSPIKIERYDVIFIVLNRYNIGSNKVLKVYVKTIIINSKVDIITNWVFINRASLNIKGLIYQ